MIQYIFSFYSGFETLKAKNPDGQEHFLSCYLELDAKPQRAIWAGGFIEAKAFRDPCSGQESLQGEANSDPCGGRSSDQKTCSTNAPFCISMCQARGVETTAFAVGDGFIQKLCKKCEKSGENDCPWATTFIPARQNLTAEVTGTVKCSFPPSSTA